MEPMLGAAERPGLFWGSDVKRWAKRGTEKGRIGITVMAFPHETAVPGTESSERQGGRREQRDGGGGGQGGCQKRPAGPFRWAVLLMILWSDTQDDGDFCAEQRPWLGSP